MQRDGDCQIRTMSRGELDMALDWAAGEGWNPGLRDAECFHTADPDGFLIGIVDGEPIGCISVVRYDERFGFLGFYMVVPDMRGRGFGYRLWQAGIERLRGCTIGLDGVIAQQDNYKRSGFALAHRNIRFGGAPVCSAPIDSKLIPLRAETVAALIRYDKPLFPAGRDTFLRCWLDHRQREGMALVQREAVCGYGVIRACRDGFKIGPLCADTEDGADLLFRALVSRVPDGPVFLDSPEPNGAACALASRYGLLPVFETARMYRGPAPALDLSRIYGITTFELG